MKIPALGKLMSSDEFWQNVPSIIERFDSTEGRGFESHSLSDFPEKFLLKSTSVILKLIIGIE